MFPPPFFGHWGAFLPRSAPFFRVPPRPFSARVARAADTLGGYIYRPSRAFFMRLSGDFREFFPIFKGFPRHAKSPGVFPGDHGAGSLSLRRIRRVTDTKDTGSVFRKKHRERIPERSGSRVADGKFPTSDKADENPGKESRDHGGCRQRDALRAARTALILSEAAALASSLTNLSLPLLYDTSFAAHSK